MSARPIDWRAAVLDDGTLTPTEKLVALVLAQHANGYGDGVWPSRDRVARLAGKSVATVKRALRVLRARGYLVLEYHGGSPRGGARMTNAYRLALPTRGAS